MSEELFKIMESDPEVDEGLLFPRDAICRGIATTINDLPIVDYARAFVLKDDGSDDDVDGVNVIGTLVDGRQFIVTIEVMDDDEKTRFERYRKFAVPELAVRELERRIMAVKIDNMVEQLGV